MHGEIICIEMPHQQYDHQDRHQNLKMLTMLFANANVLTLK